MNNLDLYNSLRTPPKSALKEIKGGRMSGKTDINPMWRIQSLTEAFGPCGDGWKIEIKRFWLEPGAGGEVAAFCEIVLHYLTESGAWSAPVPGIGGSMFVAKEKNGPYTSDECYKMAYTDAMSVACKALGVAADIYWNTGDGSKYSKPDSQKAAAQKPQPPAAPKKDTPLADGPMTEETWAKFWAEAKRYEWTQDEVIAFVGDISGMTLSEGRNLLATLKKGRKEAPNA